MEGWLRARWSWLLAPDSWHLVGGDNGGRLLAHLQKQPIPAARFLLRGPPSMIAMRLTRLRVVGPPVWQGAQAREPPSGRLTES